MTSAVKISGAFFKGDVGKQAKTAVGKVVTQVAVVGKREVQAELYLGHGSLSGAFRKRVKRRTKGLTALVWASNTMIAQWLQGVQKRNRTTKFKGYQIFDHARNRTDATAGNEARRGVAELVRILGGR